MFCESNGCTITYLRKQYFLETKDLWAQILLRHQIHDYRGFSKRLNTKPSAKTILNRQKGEFIDPCNIIFPSNRNTSLKLCSIRTNSKRYKTVCYMIFIWIFLVCKLCSTLYTKLLRHFHLYYLILLRNAYESFLS